FMFYFIVTKMIHPQFRKLAIFIGSMMISLSVFIILFQLSYVLLIVYAIVVGIFYPILNVPLNSMAYDVIGTNLYAKELRIEYVVILEVFVNIGRLISVGIFIICIFLFQSTTPIPYLLAIFSQSYWLIYVFMRNIHFPHEN